MPRFETSNLVKYLTYESISSSRKSKTKYLIQQSGFQRKFSVLLPDQVRWSILICWCEMNWMKCRLPGEGGSTIHPVGMFQGVLSPLREPLRPDDLAARES